MSELTVPLTVLNLRVEANPVALRWGGVILATFSVRAGPVVVSDARLLVTPEGEHRISLNAGRKPRVAVIDDRFKAALLAAAVAEFERKTAHPRPAVSARREGSNASETIAP